jgi:hypothetical protein
VIGFLVGYGLLSLGPWTATAHWHWLPFALIAAAITGPVVCAEGVRIFERSLVYWLVTTVAAWLLVPTWDDLDPSRAVYLSVFTVYVVVLTSLLEPLANRLVGPLLSLVLWATMTAAAVVLALSGSLRFAQIALASSAALFGILLVTCVQREAKPKPMVGGGFVFSLMSVGLLLIGRVNSFSEVPLISYLLIPAAPLTLWLTAVGPLSRISDTKRAIVRAALPLSVLAVAVLLAMIAEMRGGEY